MNESPQRITGEGGGRVARLVVLLLVAGLLPPAARATPPAEPVVLGFETLASFPYEMPETPAAGGKEVARKDQIPAAILAFSGKRAVVTGFMLPLQLEAGRARQFVLVRSQASCCFGVAPAMNEYVLVTMTNGGARPVMDAPVAVVGTLKVGETYEDGLLVGIYQMDGEGLEEPSR